MQAAKCDDALCGCVCTPDLEFADWTTCRRLRSKPFFLSSSAMPEYTCYCSICLNKTWKRLETIQSHLTRDRISLQALLSAHEAQNPSIPFSHPLQEFILRTEQALSQALRPKASRSQGPSTAGNGEQGTPQNAVPMDESMDLDPQIEPDLSTEGNSVSTPPSITPLSQAQNANSEVHVDTIELEYDSDIDEEEALDYLELQLEPNIAGRDNLPEAESDSEGQGSMGDEEILNLDGAPTATGYPPPLPSQSQPSSLPTPKLPTPKALEDLRAELLGDYICPPVAPETLDDVRNNFANLTQSERLSLRHFIIWKRTGGTVVAYQLHAKLLESVTGVEILSLYRVRKRAVELTKFAPIRVPMCPRSCIAYTGKYSDKNIETCPYVIPSSKNQKKGVCGKARYRTLPSGKKVPAAYFQVLSVRQKIEALFANAETSRQLRHRDSCLKEVLHLFGSKVASQPPQSNPGATVTNRPSDPTPAGSQPAQTSSAQRKYSDFPDSQVHYIQHTELKLFQEPRDIAIALSSDGAQLTMKKLSNTWVLILILLNLPPELRYKSENIMVAFAIPGPHAPGDVESFFYPLFQEFAQGSEGFWMWDAVDSSYFVHRFWAALANGDMLGSAKINGLVGHTGFLGDRFSLVLAARNCLPGQKAKALYYPISPPENDKYNPGRPPHIDLLNLPIRSQKHYYETINKLTVAGLSARAQARITTQTGISRLPLCAASEAFIHPTFFPLDPFHLFYENIMTFIWDIWTGIHVKDPNDPVRIPDSKMKQMGEWIRQAIATLPPSFCGPVRNPYEKRNSQYKIYEWMAILHWYLIPMAIELSIDIRIIQNFAKLVRIVEFAMTPVPRSEAELANLEKLVKEFLEEFEEVYVQGKPENISRMRLCVFQLIHVARHARWNGSVRVGSQATAERVIGELGRKIMSQKSPYANLANIIHETELVKIMCLYDPELAPPSLEPAENSPHRKQDRPYSQEHSITIKSRQDRSSAISPVLDAIERFIKESHGIDIDLRSRALDGVEVRCWGKYRLGNSDTLRSQASERKATTSRDYRWFEAEDISIANQEKRRSPASRIYGEVHAFYTVKLDRLPDVDIHLAAYTPLQQVKHTLECTIQGRWPEKSDVRLIECKHIHSIVGIWAAPSKRVYILRKHPALDILTEEERGQPAAEGSDSVADVL
ncbi:hypothetical protein NMY22_g15065 [Coprinellus aureogranulatus]|nr:hypothetical protein NMY22_g15065 [Coprinellus aureogranulatus]